MHRRDIFSAPNSLVKINHDAPIDFKQIPKVELHCHLLGVINPPLLENLNKKGHELLIPKDQIHTVSTIQCKEDFQHWVDWLKPYQSATWIAYQPIIAGHLESLVDQNVKYAELMISPLMFPSQRNELVKEFKQFRDWVTQLEQERIQMEFILVMPRKLEEPKIKKNTLDYIALYKEGLIVGVAIVGLEDGSSIQKFSKALEACKKAGLGIEIHAGEHSGPENVEDALEYGFVDRIGHGIGLFQKEQLIDKIASTKIHLEFCPTSNLRSGCIQQIQQLPIHLACSAGISFSINTDDPGFFDCSITHEYQQLAEYFQFERLDFLNLMQNTLAAKFAPKLKYLSREDILSSF